MAKICVLGAGVNGMASALRVLELCPGSEVKVIAEKFSPFTTSDVSGGFWEPHLLGDTPAHLVKKWSGATFDHMAQLANSDSAKYTGASFVSGYRVSVQPEQETPTFADKVLNLRVLGQKELQQFPGMKSGHFYTTAMLEPRRYLQWLMKRFQRKGGRMERRKVDSIDKLFAEGFDVVINCTGLGSNKLEQDSKLEPIRGQVIRAQAPWLKHFVFATLNVAKADYAHIFPSSSYVVMGGTAQVGDWNESASHTDTTTIWNKCCKYVPSLAEATIESVQVGLRPCRHSVRLELETRTVNGKTRPVVHNYGHGGSGVTLHWGCAEDAANLAHQALDRLKPAASKL